jgi:hypothetical protein
MSADAVVDAPPEPVLRGWHRPVGWRTLWLVFAIVLTAWLALMAAGLWWLHEQWQGQAELRNLKLGVGLPAGIQAHADLASTLHTRLDMDRQINFPVDQTMQVTVQGPLQARTTIKAEIPVSTTVAFEADVPVSTEVQAEVPVVSWLPAMTVTLPVKVSVPFKMAVPVRLSFPVDLDLQVRAELPQALQVPVRTRIRARVPLHADLRAVVTRRAEFQLDEGIADVPMLIERTRVQMPFKDVSWHLRPDAPSVPLQVSD